MAAKNAELEETNHEVGEVDDKVEGADGDIGGRGDDSDNEEEVVPQRVRRSKPFLDSEEVNKQILYPTQTSAGEKESLLMNCTIALTNKRRLDVEVVNMHRVCGWVEDQNLLFFKECWNKL